MTKLDELLDNVGHVNGRTSPIYAFCVEVAKILQPPLGLEATEGDAPISYLPPGAKHTPKKRRGRPPKARPTPDPQPSLDADFNEALGQ